MDTGKTAMGGRHGLHKFCYVYFLCRGKEKSCLQALSTIRIKEKGEIRENAGYQQSRCRYDYCKDDDEALRGFRNRGACGEPRENHVRFETLDEEVDGARRKSADTVNVRHDA